MKLVITGNLGYIGPSVADRLRRAFPQARLVGADMGYFGHCLSGAEVFTDRAIDVQYRADVRDLPEAVLAGADAVVHLAAISNDPMGKAFEAATGEVNYQATVRVAKRAKEAGAGAFVFASSCSVYGCTDGGPRNEWSDLDPLTAYARSKVAAEHALRELADDDFRVTCLRFPTACGMSDRLRLDLVLNDFVSAAVVNGRVTLLSDGTPWRPLIDIKDMARAVEWAVQRQPDSGGAFLAVNVGRSEWNYQVRELAEVVRRAIPGVEVEMDPQAAPDRRSYQVDFGLYQALAPRHLPQVDVEQSVWELKQGLGRMNFRDANFRTSRFMRLKVLTDLRQRGLLDERLAWAG